MKLLHLFLFITINITTSYAQSQDEDLIRETFNYYKSALLNDDGNAAINLIDSRSVTYYDDMLDKIIESDSVTVDNLPITDKLLILIVRLLCPKEDIFPLCLVL